MHGQAQIKRKFMLNIELGIYPSPFVTKKKNSPASHKSAAFDEEVLSVNWICAWVTAYTRLAWIIRNIYEQKIFLCTNIILVKLTTSSGNAGTCENSTTRAESDSSKKPVCVQAPLRLTYIGYTRTNLAWTHGAVFQFRLANNRRWTRFFKYQH
jgi:hypothetical protein